MQTTKINWTDKVWNPVTGCSKISAGCKFCYAETIANRFWKDRDFTEVKTHPERLMQPFKIKKPSKIFVNSMSDLFHAKINPGFLKEVFKVMQTAQWHTFQVLTKRPDYMRTIIEREKIFVSSNIWLGVSVEDQKTADQRIPLLIKTPAVLRWLSIEPLLNNIDLTKIKEIYDQNTSIDWIVVGCESGPRKRECKIEWIESIVGQCQQEKIPVWVKQININGKVIEDINLFPASLKVRQLPG